MRLKVGTKIPDSEVLGFDIIIITNELLSDLPFCLIIFNLGAFKFE
ncbi:7522_t:CDS:2 [Funneliformis caledonium]|uniref:7522_t:CDS:1 n=1 Tax=Funneliformis caledonium TaxID=1117310 RepID=A0A9N8YTE4_9GLOM|nr:7522_t:CDS:2 [Funneliformis caledonium]